MDGGLQEARGKQKAPGSESFMASIEIKRLPEDVISRISAGEVITRPYNILKEVMENSLDAGSRHITVRIGADGLSLRIEDDGSGIHESDFGLLCKQYCTSKLVREEELFSLSSYGFRGEALSSISRCSRIKVRSKRRGSEIGYEAVYIDTDMVSIKGVGMKDGTSVEIKNVFYNTKARERHFAKNREEIRKMIWLVETYSVFNEHVYFELFYGERLQELPKKGLSVTGGDASGCRARKKVEMLNDLYKANGKLVSSSDAGYFAVFSTAQFSLRKGVFVLFVNGRLVTSQEMKEGLFKVYKDVLPAQRYPLIYIELNLEKSMVDVNVHPSKRKVLFTEEELMTRRLSKCIEAHLAEQSYEQRPLKPLVRDTLQSPIKVYSDPTSQSISECLSEGGAERREFMLSSLLRLRAEVVDIDSGFFRSLSYVGLKDRHTALVQHGSSLLNCRVDLLLKEYFYQSLLEDFGNLERKQTRIPLRSRIGDRARALAADYFSIEVSGGYIVSIPIISTICIDSPELWSGFEVRMTSEYETLKSIADTISTLYSGAEMSPKLFNIVKRRIVGTTKALECFGLVVTLKELYKNFERC